MSWRLRFEAADFASGDLIFRRGRSLVSRAVLAVDGGSEYSHVGLISVIAGQVWVLHTVPPEEPEQGGGALAEPLSVFLSPDNATAAGLYRASPLREPPLAERAAWRFVHAHIPFDSAFDISTPRELYCTELVWRAYREAGIDLAPPDPRKEGELPAAQPSAAKSISAKDSRAPRGGNPTMRRRDSLSMPPAFASSLPWPVPADSPSSAVKSFYKAIGEGKTDDALGLLSEQTIATHRQGEAARRAAGRHPQGLGQGGHQGGPDHRRADRQRGRQRHGGREVRQRHDGDRERSNSSRKGRVGDCSRRNEVDV